MKTIDAGTLESGTVARNCTRYDSNDHVIESDICFNTGVYNLTYSPQASSCSGSYDVLRPLIHEVGHTYGMKDKEAATSYRQTMYMASFMCSVSARDLGRSDVLICGTSTKTRRGDRTREGAPWRQDGRGAAHAA